MGIRIPKAKAIEPLDEKTAVLWGTAEEGTEETGFIVSGTNEFKSGKGEFLSVGQGDEPSVSEANSLYVKTPTDSGASLTSKFEGKQAVVGVAAAKTAQEVFFAAGGEVKTVLKSTGGSNFLQLTGTNNRKINRGATTVTFPGGVENTNAITIEHGLSATPVAVVPCRIGEGELSNTAYSFTSTKFTVRFKTVDGSKPAAGTEMAFSWIAMT